MTRADEEHPRQVQQPRVLMEKQKRLVCVGGEWQLMRWRSRQEADSGALQDTGRV